MHRKQNIVLEGYGVRLRPVTVDDAGFILELRNMPHAQGKIGELNITEEEERRWLEKNILNPYDYFFIIETQAKVKLGSIGVYDIDFSLKTAEVGRVVTIPGSHKYIPARTMLNDFCFNDLSLDVIKSYVVSTNTRIINYNKQFGAQCVGILKNAKIISGRSVDMAYFELKRDVWLCCRKNIIKLLQISYNA